MVPTLPPVPKDLEPEEIEERLRRQQMESEKDAEWLIGEERNLVSVLIPDLFYAIHCHSFFSIIKHEFS